MVKKNTMLKKLKKKNNIYKKLEKKINIENFDKKNILLYKKFSKFKKYFLIYKQYKNILKELKNIKLLMKNKTCEEELINLAKLELITLKEKKKLLEKNIKKTICIKKKKENVFIEIRAASGGNEASIFTEDLFKMYTNFFNNKKWKYKVISYQKGNISGYKEIIIKAEGLNIYKELKEESGVHRVQRVPITENNEKKQTSTCSVAVLQETNIKNDITINPNEIRIDTFRSSGAGGQHVNMTDSAVRITHIPTNIVVECQNERSQHKNKNTALSILKSKILLKKYQEEKNIQDTVRKDLIGSGYRCEKIRTYNYTENRITDHINNITIYRLKDIMNGNLNLIKKNEKNKNT